MKRQPLYSFELTKIYKSKIVYIIPLILLLGMIILYSDTFSKYSSYKDNTAEAFKLEIESYEESIKELEGIEEAQVLKESLTEQKELTWQQLNAYYDSNWKEFVRLQIAVDEKLHSMIESGNAHIPVSISVIEKQIALNKEILRRDVIPIIVGGEVEGIHYVSLVLKLFHKFIGIFIFIFIVSRVFAQEIEKDTISFLKNQPISWGKIFYTKYFLSFAVSISLTIMLMILSFLIGAIFKGTGDFNYPVLVSITEDSYQFVSILKFITSSAVLHIFAVAFICSVTILIATLTKNSLITFITTVLLYILGTVGFQAIGFLSSFADLNPFFYLDSANVINMSTAEKLGNYGFSVIKGIIILSTTSVIINIITLKTMKKVL